MISIARARMAALIEQAAAGHFATEEQVLFHRQVGDQAEFLEDRADAHDARRVRRQMDDLLALIFVIAGILRVGAGDDIDERGFAGAVLAEENVHLAVTQIEIDAVQRHHAGEVLRYAGKLEQKTVGAGGRSRPRLLRHS